jgi:hypothetical protein
MPSEMGYWDSIKHNFSAGKLPAQEFLPESMHPVDALPRLVQWHEKSSCESNGHRKICGNY